MTKAYFATCHTYGHPLPRPSLISLAIVTEDGREFYAEFDDYDKEAAKERYVQRRVSELQFDSPKEGEGKPSKIKLQSFVLEDGYSHYLLGNKAEVKEALVKWLSQFEKVEFVSMQSSYSWALFCDLFGGSKFLPEVVTQLAPIDLCALIEAQPESENKVRSQLSNRENSLLLTREIKEKDEQLFEKSSG